MSIEPLYRQCPKIWNHSRCAPAGQSQTDSAYIKIINLHKSLKSNLRKNSKFVVNEIITVHRHFESKLVQMKNEVLLSTEENVWK